MVSVGPLPGFRRTAIVAPLTSQVRLEVAVSVILGELRSMPDFSAQDQRSHRDEKAERAKHRRRRQHGVARTFDGGELSS